MVVSENILNNKGGIPRALMDKRRKELVESSILIFHELTVTEKQVVRDKFKCCQICGKKTKRMALDHDHRTGKVRGTLCVNCNTALGHFFDSTILMAKAIEYLDRH